MDFETLITQTWREAVQRPPYLLASLGEHLRLSFSALGMAILIGVSLGTVCVRHATASRLATGLFNTVRVIPGLALLALMLPLIGSGFLPAVIALTILALPVILLSTMIGFQQIDSPQLETARALGLDGWQTLQRVEFPLALPYILNGVRVASVEVIAGASLAAFIGGGGLGVFIVNGLSGYNMALLLIGALPVAALAMVTDLCFGSLLKMMSRWQLC